MEISLKALVLAAGKGTRLHTEGVDLPKVLRRPQAGPCWPMCWTPFPFSPPRTPSWWWAG